MTQQRMVEEEMKTIHKTRGAIQKRAQDRKEWKDFIVALRAKRCDRQYVSK